MESTTPLEWLREVVRTLPKTRQLEHALKQIADFSECSVLLYEPSGELLGSIGRAPARLLWDEVATAGQEAAGTVGRWAYAARRSGPSGGVTILVLASNRTAEIRMTESELDAADLAVQAVLGMLRGADTRRIRENAQLLETLERGIPAAREHRYWPRVAEFGFTAHAPWILIVSERLDGLARADREIDELFDDAARHGVPLLFATRLILASNDAVAHGILPDTGAARDWLDTQVTGFAIGLSRARVQLTEVPAALREAEAAQRLALDRAHADAELGSEHVGELVDYGTAPLAAWASSESPRGEFRARRRELLAPFDEHRDLLETLIEYLAADLGVSETAATQFLHPNTVRYRLARCEDFLGASLRSPDTIADLVLALGPEIRAVRNRRAARPQGA